MPEKSLDDDFFDKIATELKYLILHVCELETKNTALKEEIDRLKLSSLLIQKRGPGRPKRLFQPIKEIKKRGRKPAAVDHENLLKWIEDLKGRYSLKTVSGTLQQWAEDMATSHGHRRSRAMAPEIQALLKTIQNSISSAKKSQKSEE